MAAAAEARLSPPTKQRVLAALGFGDMAKASTWLDEVRDLWPNSFKANPPEDTTLELRHDTDTAAFVAAFHRSSGKSKSWHYVNIPLGADGYSQPPMRPPMIGSDQNPDVVQKIGECIRALKDPNTEIHGAFGKRNALRTLIHLVGDIHQPFHVGCSYIDSSATTKEAALVTDFKTIVAKELSNDRGGNLLVFRSQNMHHFWDDDMVVAAMRAAKAPSPEDYAGALAKRPDNGTLATPLKLKTAPKTWADDTLVAARVAYKNIEVSDLPRLSDPNRPNSAYEVPIALSENYRKRLAPVADAQLQKASFRLAALLEAIFATSER